MALDESQPGQVLRTYRTGFINFFTFFSLTACLSQISNCVLETASCVANSAADVGFDKAASIRGNTAS
jgi:hypothetical protein